MLGTSSMNESDTSTDGTKQPADAARAAYSTFTVALLTVILITLVIAPARLFLLLIPGSFLLASYGMGLLLERTIASWVPPASSQSPMFTLALRLGAGISLLGFATTSFGLLGLYRVTGVLIIFALGWGIVHLSRSSSDWQLFKPTLPFLTGGLVMGIVWSIAWLWATIPPTFYDELAYHLPIAQYALRTGDVLAFPGFLFSYMPHLSDLFLGWGLALAGEIGARSMHFTFGLAIWIGGWAFVETITPPHQASWIGCIMGGAFAS